MPERPEKTVAERVYDVLYEIVYTENAGYGLWLVDESSLRQAVTDLEEAGLLRDAPKPSGDVVEVVARTLYDTANSDIGDPDPWEGFGYRNVYRDMARAAIAAMPQRGGGRQ